MTSPAPPDDAAPGEGWRVYWAFAGSFAAATPFTAAFHSLFLIFPHMRELGYGDLSWTLAAGLIAGPVVGLLLAGPPTAVYLLCRPPNHRLRTRRGWALICAGGGGTAVCLMFSGHVLLGWGVGLLPAAAAGLLVAAAASFAEPVNSQPEALARDGP